MSSFVVIILIFFEYHAILDSASFFCERFMPNIVVSAKCIRPDGTPVLALKSLVSGLVNDVAILRLRLYNSSINEIRLMIRQSTNAGQRRFHVNMTMIRGP